MLGVVFGVGSVVAMLSVGEGASAEALKQIQKLGSHNIIIRAEKPENPEQNNSTQRTRLSTYGIQYDDELRIHETFSTIERSVPAKIINKEARNGERSMKVRVVGTTPDWFELMDRRIIDGRVLSWHDEETLAGVCVMSEHTARELLAGSHTTGHALHIDGNYYYVVGIIETEGSEAAGVQTPDSALDIYIPLSTSRERFGDRDVQISTGSFILEEVELHQLILQVRDLAMVEPTADAVKTMLERFHKQKDYTMSVPLALLRQAKETQRIFNIVLGSIAGISLLVGGIGIMNIMLASVTERTREIGVRRAIGAKRRQIIGQFLIETVVLSLVGGLLGVGLGIAIPQLITHFANMPTVVTAWSVILSLSISAAVGIVFGLYPAYRAAMVDPIIALRHE
ncbi:MAG: FtsX-like permease family protein [Phycisphaera sp.]|nr:FtsX-like permease family protein [Phycisphaera sp.]